jgi:lysophospholipase L1-like esterase
MRRTSDGVLLIVMAATLGTTAWADVPFTQSNIGDSMSQGSNANDYPGDHPEYSWVQGTEVYSEYLRYLELNPAFTQEPESVSGAEMVGGENNFAAQASRICAHEVKPERVWVLLGANDVCNRGPSESDDAAANMYSVDTWTMALRAGLDLLAECLPPNARVHVLSVPRIDYLYEAGHAKSLWCYRVVWPTVGICRIVTLEANADRRAQIGARINEYNDAIASEAQAYDANTNGNNPRGVRFSTDWQGSIENGYENTSLGSFRFGPREITSLDCFHPSVAGQQRIACAAWESNSEGSGNVPACFE